MASATNIKFPDGRVELRNIITSFEKDGTNVIVFETDKVDNGHKVVGVSYLSDGMYQNIIDQNKWSEIKNYLVDILHDRIGNEDYRIVPEEVLVTADPYHPLGLRDENLDKMSSSYEAFKATKEVVVPVSEAVVTDQVLAEPVLEASAEVANAPVESVNDAIVADQPLVEPVLEASAEIANAPVESANEVIIADQPLAEPVLSEGIVSVEPVASDTPELGGVAPAVITATEEPILDPFAIADSLVQPEAAVDNVVHEDIVPPVGIDIVANPMEAEIPSLDVVQSEQVVSPVSAEIPVNEPIIVEQPVIESVPASQPEIISGPEEAIVEENDSAVKDVYLNGADGLIQQMRNTTERYIAEMNSLQEKYIKEMEEIRSEISRNLEEARGINELSKQTFDKAQSMSEGSVLELTRAA